LLSGFFSRKRKAVFGGLSLLVSILLLIYLLVPLRYLSTLEVTQSSAKPTSKINNSAIVDPTLTTLQYHVDFSTEQNIDAIRANDDFGVVYAELYVCGNSSVAAREVISQRIEYAQDRGRVSYFGTTNTANTHLRHNYRVVFDDRLQARIADEETTIAASRFEGNLCLRLLGGSMRPSLLWSNSVRLTLSGKYQVR
jgi:hypothetical protein